jgi:hypothetical protein
MVVILRLLVARHVLARPQEQLLAKTFTHFMPFVWMSAAVLAIIGLLGAGMFFTVLFDANVLFVLAILLALPLVFLGIVFGRDPLQQIVVTDRAIYWLHWGFVPYGLGITKRVVIPLETVTSVQVRRSLVGQYLNYGTLLLRLTVPPEDTRIKYVPRPYQLGFVIHHALRQAPSLPPVTEEDLQALGDELEMAYARQFIDKGELEAARQELLERQTTVSPGD